MADRVLPSRGEVAQMLGAEYSEMTKSAAWLLMGAYAEGRLVDREDINYEAVALCRRRSCAHSIDHHSRSKGRCLHDCGCPAAMRLGGRSDG